MCSSDLLEKLPFFALAAASSVLTFLAQHSGGAVATLNLLPLSVRLANTPVACVRYLGKTVWPADLSIFYPLPARWPPPHDHPGRGPGRGPHRCIYY